MKDDTRKEGHIKLLPLHINMCKVSKLVNCWLHCRWITFSPVQLWSLLNNTLIVVTKTTKKKPQTNKQTKKPSETKTNPNPQMENHNKTNQINQSNK